MAKQRFRHAWSLSDRQRFADGDRLRASSRPGKRNNGPAADEWDYDIDIDLYEEGEQQ